MNVYATTLSHTVSVVEKKSKSGPASDLTYKRGWMLAYACFQEEKQCPYTRYHMPVPSVSESGPGSNTTSSARGALPLVSQLETVLTACSSAQPLSLVAVHGWVKSAATAAVVATKLFRAVPRVRGLHFVTPC